MGQCEEGINSLASSGAAVESLQKRTMLTAILEPAKTAPTIFKGSILSVPMLERKHRGPSVAYNKAQTRPVGTNKWWGI